MKRLACLPSESPLFGDLPVEGEVSMLMPARLNLYKFILLTPSLTGSHIRWRPTCKDKVRPHFNFFEALSPVSKITSSATACFD